METSIEHYTGLIGCNKVEDALILLIHMFNGDAYDVLLKCALLANIETNYGHGKLESIDVLAYTNDVLHEQCLHPIA